MIYALAAKRQHQVYGTVQKRDARFAPPHESERQVHSAPSQRTYSAETLARFLAAHQPYPRVGFGKAQAGVAPSMAAAVTSGDENPIFAHREHLATADQHR